MMDIKAFMNQAILIKSLKNMIIMEIQPILHIMKDMLIKIQQEEIIMEVQPMIRINKYLVMI